MIAPTLLQPMLYKCCFISCCYKSVVTHYEDKVGTVKELFKLVYRSVGDVILLFFGLKLFTSTSYLSFFFIALKFELYSKQRDQNHMIYLQNDRIYCKYIN